ncbi:hypothetical protein NBH00_07830 [Paraconexibacter antarcticus]|uniref:Lipoprotein n=1 Tax=Paraconexibacter antarcticus TaxID=2949664 RepID=A0ABY5DYT1_9ACTN|nr:hypothetical protein [Paraconexibacter antarcticus]UTI66104.1 hypothetical protein NBH00_07830 [Paraconexibacter antarcticus]
MTRAPALLAGVVALGATVVLSACGQDDGAPAAGVGAAPPTMAAAPAAPLDPAVRAEQEAVHRQVTTALRRTRASRAAYGTPPAYLPKARLPVHRVLTATAAHPVLVVEGDTVAVDTPDVRARVTLVGPAVPAAAQGAAVAPARFDLTVAAGRGPVRLAARDVTIVDEHGRRQRASLTMRDGRPVPARLSLVRPVRLVLRARLPTGDGQVRLAPRGGAAVATWDFVVETD